METKKKSTNANESMQNYTTCKELIIIEKNEATYEISVFITLANSRITDKPVPQPSHARGVSARMHIIKTYI